MSKRIYDEKNKRLYQFQTGGKYYTRYADSEFCLNTTDITQAAANLIIHNAQMDRYGRQAFSFRVTDLFPEFLKHKKPRIRPRTYDLYESIWESYFEKSIGKLLIADVDQLNWDKFCDRTRSVSDFQNHKNLIMQFLKWCVKRKTLKTLPILENPKHKRRKRKIIPPAHLALIFQRARGSLLLFNSMALFMGMRRSEIMTLSWDRVDLEGHTLTLGDEDVKTNDGRHLPMNSVVHVLLMERLKDQQDLKLKTKWVFPHADRPRLHAGTESLMSAWRRCLLNCGFAEKVKSKNARQGYKIVVQYTWHDFRATFEKYSHKSVEHTDTQREKFAGAQIDVQKRIYVSMDASDLKGLEEVVTNQVPELAKIISRKTSVHKVLAGSERGKDILKRSESGVSDE